MKKQLMAAGLTAGLAAGGAAGFVFTGNSPVAIAQDSTTAAPGQTDSPSTTAPDGARPDRGAWLSEALKPLVDDTTITQEQADKVIAAIEAAKPPHPGGGHDGMRGGPGRGAGLDGAATALGITEDELRTQLRAGKSIADVATDKGVEVQTVIDAMVAEAKTRLDQAVTDQKLTQAEADQRLAEITGRITEMVNGQMPPGGPGMGGPGGPGFPGMHDRHHGGPDGDNSGTPDDSSSSTAPSSGSS